jgi:hypothetical protein
MHFFNGDFRHSPEFETYFENHQQADMAFSGNIPPFGLGEAFRYGITAGVSPQGYNADSISNHPNNVLSPEAVAAWGDMETLFEWYNNTQYPLSDTRYKYGMVRESQSQPGWVPFDAGLVDHMFLLFGLVESLDPDFFSDRVFPALAPGDYNGDGSVDEADYERWKATFGSTSQLAADGNYNSIIDSGDYVIWRKAADAAGAGGAAAVPEPGGAALVMILALMLASGRRSHSFARH